MNRDDDDTKNINSHITREQASSVIPDLFPMANDFDDITIEREGVIPLHLIAADVNSAILRLNIDRATGFSGWSTSMPIRTTVPNLRITTPISL